MSIKPTPGAKMMYLIRRRAGTSREELVAHWFKNHMPGVIARQEKQKQAGRLHAARYIATLFDAAADGSQPWDGVAQLWFDEPLPRPGTPHGAEPTDSFQQKAEPYVPWATVEYVGIDGALPVEPLTLNEPFPTTRSGFFKMTMLVAARDDVDYEAFYRYWLDVHAASVMAALTEVGALRYAVSLSLSPHEEPYAGMAELWFDNASGWARYRALREPDDMGKFVDPDRTLVLPAHTEMIGIP